MSATENQETMAADKDLEPGSTEHLRIAMVQQSSQGTCWEGKSKTARLKGSLHKHFQAGPYNSKARALTILTK